ncbi:MAG: Adenine-specific DNA methylase [Clostridium butyricum DORA_1]|nr:MAG: Adenine-specific DNA methylase [Clostridium butyricum DORA_1]MDU1508109.1 site-specific DNA-methyltransferase [Clostridium butyricum]MDU4801584.1 site-specific DNA-methyltransferase [Clostridium butyricum]
MILLGDSLVRLREINEESVDLIYLDPPFFTQKTQKQKTRDNEKEYSFDDKWENIDEYRLYIQDRLVECKRVLKKTGSIFLHCDKAASHHLRVALDNVFGVDNFQSEIIWTYKRWSNSKKGLLNNHQNIYFYSKTKDFKFNTIYMDYSETTNIDQILQDRVRNEHGKSEYKKDANGDVVLGKAKKGVPMSDIWEIPYLNPKAAERVGYPTQKPILLLERIIDIATDEGDVVLDPFMGSGTTLVAAKLKNRQYIGIDKSEDAIDLAQKRLDTPIKTESILLKKGRESYKNLSEDELNILNEIGAVPVQRNKGIDGFLKEYYKDSPVAIRIQKRDEDLNTAMKLMKNAGKKRGCKLMILVKTINIENNQESLDIQNEVAVTGDNEKIVIIESYNAQVKNLINN